MSIKSLIASFTLLVLLTSVVVGQELSTTQQQSTVRDALFDEFAKANIIRHADLRYDTLPAVDAERQSLDIYTQPALNKAPVIVFVHGGSWQRGDKAAVASKPLVFVRSGFVMVAVNYRFRPAVELADMARDVAVATAWVRENIEAYGGDRQRIILMGHSAGAQLVALLGTNQRFLDEAGVPVKSIVGIAPLDTGPYDVVEQMQNRNPASRYGEMLGIVFGADPNKWREVSAYHHIKSGLPPFLVVSSDKRLDAPAQAVRFVDKLKASNVKAEWYEAKGLDHGGVNTDIGSGDTPLTRKVLGFVKSCAGL